MSTIVQSAKRKKVQINKVETMVVETKKKTRQTRGRRKNERERERKSNVNRLSNKGQ